MAEETKRVGLLVRSTYIEHIYIGISENQYELKNYESTLSLGTVWKIKK